MAFARISILADATHPTLDRPLAECQHVQLEPLPDDPEQQHGLEASEIEVAAAAPWPPKRGTSITHKTTMTKGSAQITGANLSIDGGLTAE